MATLELDDDLKAEGFKTWDGVDPFENTVGPFAYRYDENDKPVCALNSKPHHCNASGMLHGGLLMSFADFCLFMIAERDMAGQHGVTLAMNTEFVGAVGAGQRITSTGEVVRNTRSLVFVRGVIKAGDQTLLSYSGIIKKIKPTG